MRPPTASPRTPRVSLAAGGAGQPIGLAGALDGSLKAGGPESGLLLERRIALAPGEQRTLYFLYGYLPQGTEVEPLIKKYRDRAAQCLEGFEPTVEGQGLRFETKAEPWVKRETAWHYYYLRSSLTYDDFFGEHILSQGGIYQYSMGFQGAARDPLQHALPFLFSDPQIVKEILRYTLKEVRRTAPSRTASWGTARSCRRPRITPATCRFGCCGRPASMCWPRATRPSSTKKFPRGR
jgi:hypothetical protein